MIRKIVFALIVFSAPTCAQVVPSEATPALDQYGGLLNVSTTATGYWYTHKFGNKWLLVNTEGHAYFDLGIEGVTTQIGNLTYRNAVDTKYGDHGVTWGPQAVRRLKSWGFNGSFDYNAIGEPAQPDSTQANWPDGFQPQPFPAIIELDSIHYTINGGFNYCAAGATGKDVVEALNATYTYVASHGGFDPYDPCYSTWMTGSVTDAGANGLHLPTRSVNPWFIGIAYGEGDFVGCIGYTYCGSTTLAASPLLAYDNFWGPVLYTASRTVAAKAALVTFLQGRYASIGALNTAWGSTYTGWSTDGVNRTDSCGTGDGVTLGPFTCTLAFVPDGNSVWVKVGSTVVAGEYTNEMQTVTPALLKGTTVNTGSVNHTTKAVTITFTGGNAPGNGVAVTVDSYSGGWGTGGQFLDEDGHHGWMPGLNNYNDPFGTVTSAMRADLDAFQVAYVGKFFKVAHDAIKASYPNMLYFGPNNFTATPLALQGAAPYLDALIIPLTYNNGSNTYGGTATAQANLDAISANLGDKPVFDALYQSANPDSAMIGNAAPFGGSVNNTTQKGRGADYVSITDFEATAATSGAVSGSQPIIGHRIWAWGDDTSELTNWGVVSLSDNAYDGYESVSGTCIDPWGWRCGGEPTNVRSGYVLGTGDGVTATFTGNIVDLPIVPGSVTIYSGISTPTQLASDNFTRANANPIGGNWTTTADSGVTAVQLKSNAAEGSATGESAAYNTAVVWPNDQYCAMTVGTLANANDSVICRVRNSGANHYYCQVKGPAGASAVLSLVRESSNNPTVLASGTFTINTGNVVTTQVIGSSLSCLVGTSLKLSSTDTNFTSGDVGIEFLALSGDSPDNATITNWTGGSLALNVSGTDDSNGNLSGASISSGTIGYTSPGAFSVTFNPVPINGAAVTATFTQGGWGGAQPSYVPSMRTENYKVLHNLEVAAFSPAAATNLARNKPTAASSVLATVGGGGNNYIPSRANDGFTTTTWQPAASNPQWYRVDLLGKPSVSKIVLRWGAVYATAYTLDWSDDGLSWTTAFTQPAGAGGVETDTFTAVSHRYWRGNFTARSGAGSLQLQEIEPYAQ